MKFLFVLSLFVSNVALGTDVCISLDDAKSMARGQNYLELEEYPSHVRDELIDGLFFDEKIKEFSSDVYVSSSWPGGYEGVQMFVSCTGQVSFWKGCSGDCD